jgi:polyhydroxyalkanoate synthesis regulator protein
MGRGIRENEMITGDNMRRLTFKKRRIGLLKKTMQLSLLSQCEISLRIFWKEDGSLLEYNSDRSPLNQHDADVLNHAKFTNENFELAQTLE